MYSELRRIIGILGDIQKRIKRIEAFLKIPEEEKKKKNEKKVYDLRIFPTLSQIFKRKF
jgi:hypothetical protein